MKFVLSLCYPLYASECYTEQICSISCQNICNHIYEYYKFVFKGFVIKSIIKQFETNYFFAKY